MRHFIVIISLFICIVISGFNDPAQAADAVAVEKGVSINLSLHDRLNLRNLFPKKSNIIIAVLIRDMAEKIKISQTEMDDVNMKFKDGKIVWKDIDVPDTTFLFTNAEIQLLKDEVALLDRQNKITQDILAVCLKIKEAELATTTTDEI